MSDRPSNKPRITKARKLKRNNTRSRRDQKLKGGGWWPFSNTQLVQGSQTSYDKSIEKWTKQIADLNAAIKILENKINKMQIAKQTDASIANERSKINQLNEQRNKALDDASSGNFFEKITNYFTTKN
jgi:hypothetical protein